MPETPATSETVPEINLKDPALAAFLAWLVPGLGHWYQGRRAKAVLFFVCIMGVFGYGVYLGSNAKIGCGRAVYFAFNNEEWRLPFFCQIGVGLPTLPAIIQSLRVSDGKTPYFGGFMAPPRMKNPPANLGNNQQPLLDDIHKYLGRYMELATTYTMIGGLLNVLAIYDAFAGPVIILPAKKKEEEEGKGGKKKDDEKKE